MSKHEYFRVILITYDDEMKPCERFFYVRQGYISTFIKKYLIDTCTELTICGIMYLDFTPRHQPYIVETSNFK